MQRKFEKQSPEIIARARELRDNLSLPEKLLWRRLQKRAGNQFKIRRQYPVLDRYVIDFFYVDLQLAFEIDGKGAHEGQEVYDARRQKQIEALGISFVRIPARWVLRAPDEVVDIILMLCSGELSVDELDMSMH